MGAGRATVKWWTDDVEWNGFYIEAVKELNAEIPEGRAPVPHCGVPWACFCRGREMVRLSPGNPFEPVQGSGWPFEIGSVPPRSVTLGDAIVALGKIGKGIGHAAKGVSPVVAQVGALAIAAILLSRTSRKRW